MRKSFQRPGKKNIWTKKEVSDAKPSRAPAKKRKRKEEDLEVEDRDIELVPEQPSRNMSEENGDVQVPVNPVNPPAPRYRPVTYDDLTEDKVVKGDQYILCYKCHEEGYYEFNGGRYKYSSYNGDRPTLEGAEVDSKIKVTIKSGFGTEGIFPPRKRGIFNTRTSNNMLDNHIIAATNRCMSKTDPYEKQHVAEARRRIRELNELEEKGKTYYTKKDGYEKYDVNINARTLKNMLEKERSKYLDARYRWTDETRLELLRDSMTEPLRLKIEVEANKNPKATGEDWKYEELEEWIKKLAVEPKDPSELARQYMREFGDSIDIARSKI